MASEPLDPRVAADQEEALRRQREGLENLHSGDTEHYDLVGSEPEAELQARGTGSSTHYSGGTTASEVTGSGSQAELQLDAQAARFMPLGEGVDGGDDAIARINAAPVGDGNAGPSSQGSLLDRLGHAVGGLLDGLMGGAAGHGAAGGTAAGGASASSPPLQGGGQEQGEVTEDLKSEVSGQLSAQGGRQTHYIPERLSGRFGDLVVDTDGHWKYELRPDQPNDPGSVQHLNNGDTYRETFFARLTDVTGRQIQVPVVISVHGTDDAAVISGVRTGTLTEDQGPQGTSGVLVATDIDRGDVPTFIPQSVKGAYGSFDLQVDGHWSYTADPQKIQGLKAGEQVVESFPVATTNASGESVKATVSVAIVGTDDKAVFPPVSLTAKEDGGMVIGHLVATDADAKTLSYGVAPGALAVPGVGVDPDGTVHVDPSRPEYQGLAVGEHRDLQVPVQVTDERGVSVQSMLTVRIEGTNDAPVVTVHPPVPADEGSGVHSTQVLARDVDGSDKLSYGLPAGGSLPPGVSLDGATGQVSIDTSHGAYNHLAVGEVQTVVVPVVVSDGHGGSTSTQVTFEVRGTNDAPVLAAIGQQTATEGGASISGQLSGSDPDSSDKLSYGLAGGIAVPAGLTIQPDGQWSFDPKDPAYEHLRAGEQQQVVVPVQVSDGHGGVSQQSLTITVVGTNDGAVIGGTSSGAVKEDAQTVMNGALTITDPDQGEQKFQAGDQVGTYGVLHIGADGSWSYTLNNADPKVQALGAGQQVSETLTVQSVDGTQHQITIGVSGTNDAAVITGQSSGALKEDVGANKEGYLCVSGKLDVRDVDTGEGEMTFHGLNRTALQGTYGHLEMSKDGHWSYFAKNDQFNQLKEGEQVTDRITVTSKDGTSHEVVITIAGTNDAPVLQSQSQSVTEDGKLLSSQMVATDVDGGDTQTFSIGAPVAGLTFHADGSYTFDPSHADYQHLKAGETQTLTIPVTVTDGAGATSTKDLSITITGTNDAAVITGQSSGAVKEDIGVISQGYLTASGKLDVRDVDTSESALTFHGLNRTALHGTYGKLETSPDGKWSYFADNDQFNHLKEGEQVTDRITLTSKDGTTHEVVITITGTNDAPVLQAQSQSVTEDGKLLSGQMVATDVDGGDTQTFSIGAPVAGLTFHADGSYTFDPSHADYQHLKAGETQTLTIPVTVTDGAGATSTKNLSITITGTNDAPVMAATGQQTATEGGALITGQLSGSDPDSTDQLAYGLAGGATAPAGFTLQTDGHWAFDPKDPAYDHLRAGEQQQIVVSLQVSDGHGGTSQQSLTITVVGTNDGAVITGQSSGAVKEDIGVISQGYLTASGKLDVRDVDTSESALTFHGLNRTALHGTYGKLETSPDGKWSYFADNDQFNHLKEGEQVTDRITLTSKDGTTHEVVITITGTNDAPVLQAQSQSVTEDGKLLSGQMVATDVDRGDTQSFSIGAPVAGLTFHADGSYTFDPSHADYQHLKAGETQTLTIPVMVTDGAGATSTKDLSITITGTNDAPVLAAIGQQTATEGGALITGQLSGSDPDSTDQVTYGLAGGATAPAGFTLQTDGHWAFDPKDPAYDHLRAGEQQQVVVPLQVSDGHGGVSQQSLTITVTGTNDGAVITGQSSGAVKEDIGVISQGYLTASGKLDVRDVDTGESALTFHGLNRTALHGTYGKLETSPDGKWSYFADNDQFNHLKEGEQVTDRITLTSKDGTTHEVVITITGTNDAPVLQAQSQSVTEDGKLLSGQMVATDVDRGDTQSFSIGAPVAGLTFHADGSYTFDPSHADYQHLKAGETQTLTIPVTVTDGAGATSTKDLSITITGTNDAPAAALSTSSTSEDNSYVFKAADFAYSDPEGDSLHHITITALPPASEGQLIFAGTAVRAGEEIPAARIGELSFQPAKDFNGDSHFSFSASDGSRDSTAAQMTVHIAPVADQVTAEANVGQDRIQTRDLAVMSAYGQSGHGGIELYAFGVGTSPLNPTTGSIDPSHLKGTATLQTTDGTASQEMLGLGVLGGKRGTVHGHATFLDAGGMDIGRQGHSLDGSKADDSQINQGESLLVKLPALANSAQLTLGAFNNQYVSNDHLTWHAYDSGGHEVSSGVLQVGLIHGNNVEEYDHLDVHSAQPFAYLLIKGEAPLHTPSGRDLVSAFSVKDINAQLIVHSTELVLGEHFAPDYRGHGESVVFRVDGLTPDSSLDHGIRQSDGSWLLSEQDASRLHLLHTTEQHLTITAISHDGTSERSGTPVSLDVAPSGSTYEVISGRHTGEVADLNPRGEETSGDLQVDRSSGLPPEFVPQTVSTPYGTFEINAHGHWHFQLDSKSSDVIALALNEVKDLPFNVSTNDGLHQLVTVSIHGADQNPVVGGIVNGIAKADVTEDKPGQTSAGGQVTFVDPDSRDTLAGGRYLAIQGHQSGLLSANASTTIHGKYGDLVIQPDGRWFYQLDHDKANSLVGGQTEKEVFNLTPVSYPVVGGVVDPNRFISLRPLTIQIAVHGTDEGTAQIGSTSVGAFPPPPPPAGSVVVSADIPDEQGAADSTASETLLHQGGAGQAAMGSDVAGQPLADEHSPVANLVAAGDHPVQSADASVAPGDPDANVPDTLSRVIPDPGESDPTAQPGATSDPSSVVPPAPDAPAVPESPGLAAAPPAGPSDVGGDPEPPAPTPPIQDLVLDLMQASAGNESPAGVGDAGASPTSDGDTTVPPDGASLQDALQELLQSAGDSAALQPPGALAVAATDGGSPIDPLAPPSDSGQDSPALDPTEPFDTPTLPEEPPQDFSHLT